jgi:hypothetical protein
MERASTFTRFGSYYWACLPLLARLSPATAVAYYCFLLEHTAINECNKTSHLSREITEVFPSTVETAKAVLEFQD